MQLKLFKEELEKLQKIRVKPNPPKDFRHFWNSKLELVKKIKFSCRRERLYSPIEKISAFDLYFNSFDGTIVHGIYVLPPEAKQGKVPLIISFHGAGGDCSTPDSYASYLMMGIAVLAIDFRLQSGETGSSNSYGAGPSSFIAMGITDKNHCSLLYMICDALSALELSLRSLPEVDTAKIAITGGSQGGGVTLSVAGLSPHVKLAIADVPSACWFEKRVFDKTGGAAEIAKFIKNNPDLLEPIMENLSYFDNLNFAPMIKCPVLISCGLRDPVCPPDGIYAVFHNIKSEKKIYPYPFAEHEGGSAIHHTIKLKFLKEKLL